MPHRLQADHLCGDAPLMEVLLLDVHEAKRARTEGGRGHYRVDFVGSLFNNHLCIQIDGSLPAT